MMPDAVERRVEGWPLEKPVRALSHLLGLNVPFTVSIL